MSYITVGGGQKVKIAFFYYVIGCILGILTVRHFSYPSTPRNKFCEKQDFILLPKAIGWLLLGWFCIRFPFEFRIIGIFGLLSGLGYWGLKDIWASGLRVWSFIVLAAAYWYYHPDLILPHILFFIPSGKYFFWAVMIVAGLATVIRISNRLIWLYVDFICRKYDITDYSPM